MRVALFALLFAALAVPASAAAYLSPGAPVGHVNDFAGILSESTKAEIEQSLVAFQASTSNEIALVTVQSLGGDYIENYIVELFKEWGVGTAENDNGVLILLAYEDRVLRIEVGYGLEGALPDSVASTIVDEMIVHLKDGDYDAAALVGVESVIAATQGEYTGTQRAVSSDWVEAFFGVFIFAVLLLQWALAVLSRTKSYWAGGVVGAVLGAIVSSVFAWWLVSGLLVTLGLAVLGLLFDFAVSGAYHESVKKGTTPPWWTGGSGGLGGSSGSGGFGGFGGGSSGGGGASGSW